MPTRSGHRVTSICLMQTEAGDSVCSSHKATSKGEILQPWQTPSNPGTSINPNRVYYSSCRQKHFRAKRRHITFDEQHPNKLRACMQWEFIAPAIYYLPSRQGIWQSLSTLYRRSNDIPLTPLSPCLQRLGANS